MFDSRLKKGIYFIPSLLTMGNILCGFFAVISSFIGNWLYAGIAIGVAFVLDGLDGRIARFTDTETQFGLELDSHADLLSFGVAPAVLAYTRWLYLNERLGILLGFLFTCGAALRLARFNAHDVKEESMDYFNGFPTPAAAGVVVSLYFLEYIFYIQSPQISEQLYRIYIHHAIPVIILILSYLMLSNLRYPSFKDITFIEEHPFGVLFVLLFFIFVAVLNPLLMFSLFFLFYLLTGFLNLGRLVKWLIDFRQNSS